MTEFFFPGHSEKAKLAVHGGLFALSAVCVVYNACAWYLRGDLHLLRNVAMYSALAGVELAQMERHRDAL